MENVKILQKCQLLIFGNDMPSVTDNKDWKAADNNLWEEMLITIIRCSNYKRAMAQKTKIWLIRILTWFVNGPL